MYCLPSFRLWAFLKVSWNAKVGMNISNFTGDFDMNAKVGFKIGGGMEYGFNEIWSLQPSLFVSSKGAKKDELSVNAVYLELPVMAAARFKVADNTNIVLSAGPYFACGIAGNSKVDLGKGRLEVDTFGDDGLLKRGDVGLGIGVARWSLARLSQGLTVSSGLSMSWTT